MNQQPYFVVNAFTFRPFSGNPAAVVPLDRWPCDEWLHKVANQMNLSETAFFVPAAIGFELRWFTPKVEVDLCGHATLATACVLSHRGQLEAKTSVEFSTRSGVLKASHQGTRFELDFPIDRESSADQPAGLLKSLNIQPRYLGRGKFDYLVEVDSEASLSSISPDFQLLAKVPCRGVIVTCRSSDPQFDFVSRFFSPVTDVNEDPVTGSAHCCLADFWGRRLNKTALIGYQASPRGGIVHVEVRGERVLLAGEATIFAEGSIMSHSPDSN